MNPESNDYVIYFPKHRPNSKYRKMIGKITKSYNSWYIAEYKMENGDIETTPIYNPTTDIVYWSKNKEDCVEILNNINAYLDSKKYNL